MSKRSQTAQGHANWDSLQSESFRKGLEDIERKRLKGEANTREKIIEPILFEVLGFDRNENDAEHAVKHARRGGGRAGTRGGSAA